MKKLKLIIDIIMYILFIILIGHHITTNTIHEILGTIIFVLLIIHHFLKFKYYKSLFKGKYNTKRVLIVSLDILLLLSMLGIMISAINISTDVFSFLNNQPKLWGRKLHMLSTSWGFIIISLHVGMHLSTVINRLQKKINKQVIYYIILTILIIYGIYSFIKLDLLSDMFLLKTFKYYDYSESWIVFYIHVLAASLLMSLIINIISNNKAKRKKV